MKPLLPILGIALALVIAVILHSKKIDNNQEDQQIIADGLQGVKKQFSTNQTIKILNKTSHSEFTVFARLVLAPNHADGINKIGKEDTILLISIKNSDSNYSPFNRVLWERTEKHLHFQLLTHN